MASQFSKRKAKAAETAKEEMSEVTGSVAVEVKPKQVYTQEAYDIYTDDGGKTYHVAQIAFNPQTGEAEVVDQFDITRIVALQYQNQKTALKTLKKGKK